MFTVRFFTSLDKIFPDTELQGTGSAAGKGRMLSNERYSFQLAYRFDGLREIVRVKTDTRLAGVSVRRVGYVPAEYVHPVGADGNFERTQAGLFPDPLFLLPADGALPVIKNGTHALWITVDGSLWPDGFLKEKEERTEDIRISFEKENGETLAEAVFSLTVFPERLPEQRLLFTQWFHTDCLAHWYHSPVLSEEWWQRVEQYLACAAKNGINLILTPVFTPPLDTAVGGERLTVQLVGVEETQGDSCPYRFEFSNLKRWIAICQKYGIRHFEISHLFTQWGAGFAPKIMAERDGRQERIFGWDTKADSMEYREFLDAFLPSLVNFLREEGVLEHCFFHVSDEPEAQQLEAYRAANEMVKKNIGESRIMDAISDYSFYENGLIDLPVCGTNHIGPFLEKKTNPLFAYYCCAQTVGVSNRMFGMPQVRNRAIGVQLYSSGVQGFLHWGLNYWLSPGSARPVDPYAVTDCESTFGAGDSFSVYPSEEGPVESSRMAVFYDALQDVRLLELLEEACGAVEPGGDGKAAVAGMLESWPYTAFDKCPSAAEPFWELRDRLYDRLRELRNMTK